MTRQEDVHVFQGMKRDSHPIKQDKSFLWDAHNIRLTTREGDTFMSLTNEKSTKELIKFNSDEKYIGHTVVGDYLILLVHGDNNDVIYRINLNTLLKEILYIGELNFDPIHPAQIISSYEAELVQKIYWVDGINSPRVMNIAKPELVNAEYDNGSEGVIEKGYSNIYTDAPFDFVQSLELKEEVSIEKMQSGSGMFPSGVIQYAFTYLHRYGQESNIFYVSELMYLAYSDRGGGPEDKISASFKITIKNIDKKFQYIRVYSIVRTSIDATPTVTRVTDFDISSINSSDESSSIEIIDNNTTGETVDPTYLLYVGGKDIIANCIATKDNTLFLGGITYKRKSIYDLDIRDEKSLKMKDLKDLCITNRNISLPVQDADLNYANQLSTNTATFKNGETYRLGCRFQYKTGEWSEPIWIDDKIYSFSGLSYENGELTLGQIECTIPDSVLETLIDNGYKKVQALIVQPSYRDRTILAQGILCPTVGNVGNRKQGGGAWAQSSWLLRPWVATTDSPEQYYKGAVPACIDNKLLNSGKGRDVELQNMALDITDYETNDAEDYYGCFLVDQSIVTMHSPDIEFGNISELLKSETGLETYKVGGVMFNQNKGEIDIQTATTVCNPDASGFIKRSLLGGGRHSLISGLFYEDSMIDDADKGKTIYKYQNPSMWMTYMWHRTGSLNNDCARPEGTGTRTAELKKKVIVNLKTSDTTTYHKSSSKLENWDIKSFDSDELSLVRLKGSDNSSKTYYGNVDTLIPAYKQYKFVLTNSLATELKTKTYTFEGTTKSSEPVTIVVEDLKYSGKYTITSNSINTCTIGGSIVSATKAEFFIYNNDFTGTITTSTLSYVVSGTTNYEIEFNNGIGTPPFSDTTYYLDDNKVASSGNIGDYVESLKWPKDGIRMKYKSTPHAVISLQTPLTKDSSSDGDAYLYLAELQHTPTLRYGGDTMEALKNNLWIPAGPSLPIDEENKRVVWQWGDTWYQKYDCLKTYPFTFEDINQVIEIGSFYCETRVNMDGRYDRNRGSTSFTLSPTNFNLINPVYSQLDNFFTSRMLDDDYYKVSDYPSQFLWTDAKSPAADADVWTNLHLSNSYDMDGDSGKLVSILPFNELLIGFQEKAVSQILFNSRVQVQTSDAVPVELANSQKVTGVRAYSNIIGCQDKFSMVATPMGIYFIDNSGEAIYKFDGQLSNISYQLGHLYWARENYANNDWMYKSNKEGNPGIRIYYDNKYQDVYFTPSLASDGSAPEALCFSEQLGQFTSMMSYGGAVMFSWRNKFLSFADDTDHKLTLWENFAGMDYNNIFGVVRPFSFSFISNDNSAVTKIFDTIELRADLYDNPSSDKPVPEYEGFSGTNQVGKPFSFIRVSNEYQDTGDVQFTDNSLRKKFRIWRGIIPRVDKLKRIRNTWAKITLGMTEPSNKMMITHDLSVKYTM